MPTFSRHRLLIASLAHFWKTNVAIVLGVVVAAAVIGGALIVGDSVRASLRQMTLDRLGDIDYALTGHRFFREQLADDLARNSSPVAPAIVLVGGIEHKTESAIRRAGQVNVYGVDSRTWTLIAPPDSQPPRSS